MGLFDDVLEPQQPEKRGRKPAGLFDDVLGEGAPVSGLPSLGQPLSAASQDEVADLIGVERRERSTPGDLSDLFLRGVVGLPQLAADALQLPANVGDALARSVGMDPTQVPALYGARQILGAIDEAADYLPEQLDRAGIGTPSVSGGQLVESFVPSADLTLGERAGNIGRFALEQSVRSSPDMAAAVVATPAYIAGRANQIAENRAANDNRTDPTLWDLGVAGVAAPIEALLERFTTMRLLPGGTSLATPGILPALARIAKELGIQGTLGGIEELAPYLAENAGTELGATTQGALEAFTGGAVAEGALGGVAQGSKEAINAIGPDGRRVRPDAPAATVQPDAPRPTTIDPTPALGDDAELDALLLRNLPPEIIEGALGDPTPAPAAPTPTPAGQVPERASLPAQDLAAEIAARMRQRAQEQAAQSADAPRARTVPPPSQEIAAPAAPTTPAAEDVQASAAERLPAAGADLGALYQRGNGRNNSSAQAIRLPDGTWRVRQRKAGQWQSWEQRDTFDPSPAFGYRATGMAGGAVNIPGVGKVPVQKLERQENRREFNPLLDLIANSGGISRADAARFGVDPAEMNRRRGIKPLFSDKGVALDDLRQTLLDDRYLPPEDPNAPPRTDLNDVWDLVSRALSGEPVAAMDDPRMVEFMAQREADMEATDADLDPDDDLARWFDEASPEEPVLAGDEAEALSIAELAERAATEGADDFDIAPFAGEADGAYAARLWQLIQQQEARRGPDREAEAGNLREGVQRREGRQGASGFALEAQPAVTETRREEVAPPESFALAPEERTQAIDDDAARREIASRQAGMFGADETRRAADEQRAAQARSAPAASVGGGLFAGRRQESPGDEYERMALPDLREAAKLRGIKSTASMGQSRLVAELRGQDQARATRKENSERAIAEWRESVADLQGKQPWEMTREEWDRARSLVERAIKQSSGLDMTGLDAARDAFREFFGFDQAPDGNSRHELAVLRALENGEPVPERVRAEYRGREDEEFRFERRSAARMRDLLAGPLESTEDATFFSAATRAITEGKGAPKRADAAAWKGWLDGAVRRGDMKQSERDWLGIDAWLAERGNVTREELADFVRANAVQVQDVVLGAPEGDARLERQKELMRRLGMEFGVQASDNGDGTYDLINLSDDPVDRASLPPEAERLYAEWEALETQQQQEGGEAKFADYQLPGGSNYRELLLTLPMQHAGEGARVEFANSNQVEDFLVDMDTEGFGDLDYGRVDGTNAVEFDGPIPFGVVGLIEANRGAIVKGQDTAGQAFVSSHFTQPNILAHVRFNERTDADGKRVLFIEEIQSDWHQAGRKRGYRGTRKTDDELRAEQQVLLGKSELSADDARRIEEIDFLLNGGDPDAATVPDAPFKSTDEWAMLAFKRMVRWAAEHGFERIAWTTGAQQAERYDLRKQVDEVNVFRHPDGERYDVSVKDKGGRRHDTATSITASSLADQIGKDLADKAIQQAPKSWQTYAGLDLAVGGEGMAAFYDRILPAAVNKWAKRFGGRVGQVDIGADPKRQRFIVRKVGGEWAVVDVSVPGLDTEVARFETDREAIRDANRRDDVVRNRNPHEPQNVHGLDLTPAMRDAALQGQPLFQQEATELTDDDLTEDERRVLRRSSPAERNALATLRAESAREQGERDAGRLRDAVRAAVGDSPVRVAYSRGMAGLKGLVNDSFIQQLEDRQRLRGTKMRTSGLYITGKQTIDGDPLVVLFTDVANTPELAAFTAAHEIAGHHGLRSLLGADLDKALTIAEQNPTVKAVADSMMRRRKMAPSKRLLAIEEALADLAAASRTGDYAAIVERHGVEVPTAQRKTLAGAIARFIERVKALFAKRGATFTDAQVHDLLADAWRAGQSLDSARAPEPLESVDYTPEQSAEARRADAAATLPVDRGTSGWNYDEGVWEGRKGALKRARAVLQDKMAAWADVQKQIEAQLGRVLPDAQNVHRLENLMHGRVSEAIDRIEREQVEPLVKAMKAAGLDLATFEEYLYARHAQERNAAIAKINPKMPDGGSGMTNAEAAAILANADRARLEPLARRVDAITRANRRRLLQNGLITQDAHDAMEAQYQFYVPLRGQSEARRQQRAEGSRGLDTRRAPVKQALGRGAGNRATNLLGEVVGDAQRGVILGEKARVGRAVMRIVLANPNPDLWTLEPVQVERALDANGEVYEKVVTDWSDPSIVAVRHKGKLYRVQFQQPELAQALNHVGVDRIDAVTRVAGAVNRYFSAVLTKYNPAFTGVNMTRDALFGLTGLAVEHGELVALDAALHYPQAARAAYRQARGKDGDSEWDRYAREFAEAGGKTGYVNMPSIEDLQRKIGKGRFGGYSPEGAARAARAVADMVGDINDAVENALRLSAYVTLRKRGMTTEQAAEVAKNLTVNFNRKGFEGSRLNAWFLFYSAAMQGAHRAGKLFRQPKTYAYLGALAAIQTVATLAALGYEDDDGEPLWNKIPDHVKRRNIVIVRPDGYILTIPMPYGFNVFPYAAGRITGALADGETRRTKREDRAGKIASDIVVAGIDGLFPVPITEGAFGLAPEIVGIPLSIQANRDDFGRPIHREDPYGKSDTPRASMGRPDTLEIFKLTATGLNRLGGGDALTPPDAAALDVAPEDIEYLLQKLGGGTLKFVVDTATLGQKAAGTGYGEQVSVRDVPIINRFASRIDEQASQQALFYQRRDVIERALKRVRVEYNSKGPEQAEALLASLPELTGAKFRRRKRDGDNGPAGSIIEVNGNPQIVVGKSDSVFGAYKAAEDAMKDRNEGVEAGYAVTPAGFLPTDASRKRDAMIRRENTIRQAAQDEMTRMWTRDVVGFAERGVGDGAPPGVRRSSLPEARRAEYVGIGKGGRATPAPAVLKGARNAPKMVMVGSWAELPEPVRDGFDKGANGLFDPESKKVYVLMGMPEKEAAFVAYHEIAGHYGLQGALGDDYESVLNRAMDNPTVKKLSEAMLTTGYHDTPNRLARVEEALAELAAARRTGDYDHLERTRGVKIPAAARPGLEGMLSRVVQLTKRKLADLIGDEPKAYSDEQVYGLIEDAWQYVETGA